MPKCIILVGVPASGKSTWLANSIEHEFSLIVSTDMIIEELADAYGFTYDQIFKDTINFAEKVMMSEMNKAFAFGDADFVIDRTNLSVKSRKKFIDKLKLHKYEIECVVFPLPGTDKLSSEEWGRRLESRPGKTIPGYILSSMIEHYEPPTLTEGFSKITII